MYLANVSLCNIWKVYPKEINVPILYVTHSLDELLRLADRVVLMENGIVKDYDSVEKNLE